MSEHRKKYQDCNDLQLDLLLFLSDVMRQVMQPQHQNANRQDEQYQEYSRYDQQHVGLLRSCNEPWQVRVRSRETGVDILRHDEPFGYRFGNQHTTLGRRLLDLNQSLSPALQQRAAPAPG